MTRQAHEDNQATTDWVIEDVLVIDGHTLVPGARLSIAGERGSFVFLRYVTRPNGHSWLDVIGGTPGCTKFRSFRPDRVRALAS